MKRILWTVLLLALLGGGGYGYWRYRDTINALAGVKQDPSLTASSVVTVLNNYYYHVTLPDGQTFYYSELTDGNFSGLTTSPDSIVPTTTTGAGVFIDNAGTIITSTAIADPGALGGDVKLQVQDLIDRLIGWAEAEQKERSRHYRLLADSINACYDIDKNDSIIELDPKRVNEYRQKRLDLMSDILKARDVVTKLRSIDATQVKFGCHNAVRVAYNGSVIEQGDMVPCEVLRSNSTVCLLRLNNGVTPASSGTLTIPSKHEAGLIAPDAAVRSLPAVGATINVLSSSSSERVDVKSYSGHVSQQGTDTFLIDMNTSPQVIGSPVINEYGDLVGIIIGHLTDAANIRQCASVSIIETLLNQQ